MKFKVSISQSDSLLGYIEHNLSHSDEESVEDSYALAFKKFIYALSLKCVNKIDGNTAKNFIVLMKVKLGDLDEFQTIDTISDFGILQSLQRYSLSRMFKGGT